MKHYILVLTCVYVCVCMYVCMYVCGRRIYITNNTTQWEEQTGKSYRSLSYLEREQANTEIKAMKDN